jgi:hypothetical protein
MKYDSILLFGEVLKCSVLILGDMRMSTVPWWTICSLYTFMTHLPHNQQQPNFPLSIPCFLVCISHLTIFLQIEYAVLITDVAVFIHLRYCSSLSKFLYLQGTMANVGWRERNEPHATNPMFIIKLLSQHVLGIIMPIIRRTRPCTTAYGVLYCNKSEKKP